MKNQPLDQGKPSGLSTFLIFQELNINIKNNKNEAPKTVNLSIMSIEPDIIESVKTYNNSENFIYQAAINSTKAEIDFSPFEPNNYFLIIKSNEGEFARKILKT